MRMRLGHVAFVLLIFVLVAPVNAATYDANGGWSIWLDSGQGLSDLLEDIHINSRIVQFDDDRFLFEAQDLALYTGIPYVVTGDVKDADYLFDDPLSLTISLKELPVPIDIDANVTVTLDSFTLTQEDVLEGRFFVSSDIPLSALGLSETITFSGIRTVVPLPAAAWFLGSGIVTLLGLRRKNKA